MALEIEEIRVLFLDWESNLSKDQKKYMHFYSFRNFVFHFNNLSDRTKENVLQLLNDYIFEVNEESCSFDKHGSYDIANRYLNKIADFYNSMNFKLNLRFSFVIYWGLLIDIILYVANLLPEVKNIPIPILTFVMMLYYGYLGIFKKPKKLVYGLFY